jgi:hypothetical protein
MQPGDVPATFAEVDDLTRDTGFKPSTSIEEGVRRFTDWYVSYYQTESGADNFHRTNGSNKQDHEHIQLSSVGFDRAAVPK